MPDEDFVDASPEDELLPLYPELFEDDELLEEDDPGTLLEEDDPEYPLLLELPELLGEEEELLLPLEPELLDEEEELLFPLEPELLEEEEELLLPLYPELFDEELLLPLYPELFVIDLEPELEERAFASTSDVCVKINIIDSNTAKTLLLTRLPPINIYDFQNCYRNYRLSPKSRFVQITYAIIRYSDANSLKQHKMSWSFYLTQILMALFTNSIFKGSLVPFSPSTLTGISLSHWIKQVFA